MRAAGLAAGGGERGSGCAKPRPSEAGSAGAPLQVHIPYTSAAGMEIAVCAWGAVCVTNSGAPLVSGFHKGWTNAHPLLPPNLASQQ